MHVIWSGMFVTSCLLVGGSVHGGMVDVLMCGWSVGCLVGFFVVTIVGVP